MFYHDIIQNRREENPFLKSADLAYDLLLESIITGELKPGDKILQDTFAKKFNMSRTPIRDALLRLKDEKYIQDCGHQGFVVCQIFYSDYSELSKFRSILEEGAIKLAIRNFNNGDLEKIKENVEESEQIESDEDTQSARDKLLKLDLRFHEMIIRGSNNQYLICAYENNISRYYFYQGIVRRAMYNISYAIHTHKRIYQALLERNESEAVQLIHEHCEFYNKRSIQVLFESMQNNG